MHMYGVPRARVSVLGIGIMSWGMCFIFVYLDLWGRVLGTWLYSRLKAVGTRMQDDLRWVSA